MKIVIIGGGAMGRALYDGWIAARVRESSIALQDIAPERCCGDPDTLLNEDGPKLVVLAVKPQHIITALNGCLETLNSGDIITSIAAGVRVETIRELVTEDISIARAMPNLPVALNAGSIGITHDNLDQTAVGILRGLWEKLGMSFMISENQMDAFTAVSGSGPAYFFQFVEALSEQCVPLGLDEEIAELLVSQVMLGAARMLTAPDSFGATKLRNMVTSPGGTTEQGLLSLNADGKLAALGRACLMSARDRAVELSSEL